MSDPIENYIEKMELLHMSKECESQIMDNIRNKEYCRKEAVLQKHCRRRLFLKEKAVVALATVVITGGTFSVFGTQIREKFVGIFSKNEDLRTEVFQSDFYDNDGHVEVKMEEIVSDTMTVRAVVHYTALDGIGQEWMKSSLKSEPGKHVYMVPEIKSDDSLAAHNKGFTWETRFLENDSDESDMFFELDYFASNTVDDIKQVRFYHAMPTKTIRVLFGNDYEIIDISEAVPMQKFALNEYTEDFGEKNYLPTWIKVSKFGLIVGGYSKNAGIIYRYNDQYTAIGMQGLELTELTLVYKNGESCDLLNENTQAMGQVWKCTVNSEWNDKKESDVSARLEKLKDSKYGELEIVQDGSEGEDVFYSISFYDPIKPQEIQGIVIDGCMYELEIK